MTGQGQTPRAPSQADLRTRRALRKLAGELPDTDPASSGGMGPPGQDGVDGEDAYPIPGPQGQPGAAGATGPAGPPGVGMPGEDAEEAFPIPGQPGPAGATGATGSTGSTGATGATGPAGPLGPPGLMNEDPEDPLPPIPGVAGVAGTAGTRGTPGQDADDAEDMGLARPPFVLPFTGAHPNTQYALLDNGKFAPVKQFLGWNYVQQDEATTSTTYVDLPTLDAVTFRLDAAGDVLVFYNSASFNNQNNGLNYSQVYLDGAPQISPPSQFAIIIPNQNTGVAYSMLYKIVGVSAGLHTVSIKHHILAPPQAGHWSVRGLALWFTG